MDAIVTLRPREISVWQQWLHHPEKLWVRRVLFQIHLWVGMLVAAYIFVMSISGSAIVYRNELESSGDPKSRLIRVVEWLVDFHSNLLSGDPGRHVNAMGASLFALLCLTGAVLWWPGILHWRRSLTLNLNSSFARMNWDFHNVLGFWCFLFLVMWGISGIYLAFPQPFNVSVDLLNPGSPDGFRLGDELLLWLANLHFGRFAWYTKTLWSAIGLVPAILAFTGIFMCCHRIFRRAGAPLPK